MISTMTQSGRIRIMHDRGAFRRQDTPGINFAMRAERKFQREEGVIYRLLFLLFLWVFGSASTRLEAAEVRGAVSVPGADRLRFGFVGLHGGMFDVLRTFEKPLNIQLEYLTDQDIRRDGFDLGGMDVVFLQHLRAEDKDRYTALLTKAKARNSRFAALTCSPLPGDLLPDLVKQGIIVNDPEIHKYYSFTKDNLRRMLSYAAIQYGGRPGTIEPALDAPPPLVYHPDFPAGFPDIPSFLNWATGRRPDMRKADRVLIVAHALHLVFQQSQVVDALIRECEKKGFLAVCITDGTPGWEGREMEFKPDVVVHTCHGSEDQKTREKIGVPHFSSLYTKARAMERFLQEPMVGLAPGELQHQVISQELKGTIEPLFVGATLQGGGSDETILPVQDRVEHLISRVASMIRLQQKPASQKKIAIVYYDRSMGKSELMRGTASGMFLNAPRSLLRVLKRLGQEGYTLNRPPETEEDLLGQMQDHGRQIGIWAPDVLDQLASSGKAVLIPAETYQKWFESKVPEIQRQQVIKQWGPPPGKFLVWEKDGHKYIVVPRVEVGNIVLIPQPLRGEAQTVSALNTQTHDKLTPPPHNFLATYFWLQEGFGADALVHFGTHGSEFLLPGKPDALTANDWCDILIGHMPNISLWIVNNVGESTPVRRRSYATIVDHLTPPLVEAELSDDLKNLQADIQKWETVEDGALKDKFIQSISRQTRDLRMDKDLHLNLSGDRSLTTDEVAQVSLYLETIANEMTPTSLHVLGEIPSRDLLTPYLVRCAGQKFLNNFGKLLPSPGWAETLSESVARKKAEEALDLVLLKKLSPIEAMKSQGCAVSNALPASVQEGFDLMTQMNADFQRTGQEIDNLVLALNGRFVPPGPANSPDRNPGAIPTGRDMFVVNPEEIPTPQSWEIGKRLMDELLKEQTAKKGRYPNKIAFSLSAFSSYRDYGVIESQIFYLMGVRPIWNAKRLVGDVEIIPGGELGRPRIDVFLSARSYYRDQLPTRMRLIDKAVRMVAALDEPENYVRQNTLRVKAELEKGGMNPARSEILSKARMFGWPPGQNGSAWYYYLAEKTGEWNHREDLMRTYLEESQYVYTEDCWGENAPEAYERTIQGSEMVIRSWADTVSSPLANKYTWFIDGSLAQAIQHLTGKEPDFFLADVRDLGKVRMVRAEDALETDFRVRLFNRKWIEGMMKEGYAGVDQVAVHVSNMLGWKIMRENSVAAENWQEVVNVYVRDSKALHIREWFDQENPYAFQGMTQVLLETIRKGYWTPDEATVREIATAHAKSVIRYGKNNGLRGGGNVPFQEFIQSVLNVPGDQKAQALVEEYKAARKTAETVPADKTTASPAPDSATMAADRNNGTRAKEQNPQTPPKPATPPEGESKQVSGEKLEPAPASERRPHALWLAAGLIFLGLLVYGFVRRKGSIR
jgi:cobaltochelatase CobN